MIFSFHDRDSSQEFKWNFIVLWFDGKSFVQNKKEHRIKCQSLGKPINPPCVLENFSQEVSLYQVLGVKWKISRSSLRWCEAWKSGRNAILKVNLR